ncbi:MAG: hypothetical protein A7315_01955 [Candidatus Altiarchaeales archaeon WOR_SM1_79]|nr:MAG: hypothetical protein A7315_01955 [Candidatus Altiarchaeales archaeon WOR_SM1_79]
MFQNLTFREIESLAKQNVPIIIPVAQIEAHGPHLPVGAYLYCAEEICRRAAIAVGGLVGLPITLGDCADFTYWPGHITVSAQTLIAIFRDYCESLRAQGFGRLAFFCCAGGNIANTLHLAAGEYFKDHHDADIVLVTLNQLLHPQTTQMIQKQDADPMTSMMLAIRPDLVHLDKLKEVEIKSHIEQLRQAYCFREGYRLSDFFPDGVYHVRKGCTKEVGEKIMAEAADSLGKLGKE